MKEKQNDKSNNLQLICLHFNDMMSIVIADKSIETGHNIMQKGAEL